ncbi:hypothetical protein [Nocardia sp. NPDC005366]|uniref:hypothetical protein n=1 Tax=Nocardia sp. NPDC005366 TaxID=3156878 RepID=UPI0033B1EDFB
MEVSGNKFELLANYLDAHFGNIYEYNMNGGDVGYDVQEWTDELRDVVKQFFSHELPSDVASWLLRPTNTLRGNDSDYQKHVDRLLATREPWEVALEVHNAAVAAVPTLYQLIGHSDTWQSEDDRLDAVTWLEAHADGTISRELATHSGHGNLLQVKGSFDDIHDPRMYELVDALTPAELLDSWAYVVGPADSDRTHNLDRMQCELVYQQYLLCLGCWCL